MSRISTATQAKIFESANSSIGAWRLAVADGFSALTPYCAALFAIIGWFVAGLAIILPRWRRAGKPGSPLIHTVVEMLIANLWVTLWVVLLGFLLLAVSWLITLGAHPVITVILISLGGLVMLVILITLTPVIDDW